MAKSLRTKFIIGIIFVSTSITPIAFADSPRIAIEFDVVGINTPYGNPVVTLGDSQAIVDKLNEGLADATNGQIKITLRNLLPNVTANQTVQSVEDIYPATGISPAIDPGFTKAILVGVINRNPNLPFAGMGSGNYMLLDGTWDLTNLAVITHELGHNLGLFHANSAICTTQAPITCDQSEYGDYSSIMGTYYYGYASNPYMARFSATELDALGLLPENKKILATNSAEYKIAPVYSQIIDLPSLIYIPIGNQNIYSIEYRPAYGNETSLSLKEIDVPGTTHFYSNIPSYGIQMRINNYGISNQTNAAPTINNYPKFGTSLLVSNFTDAQVQALNTPIALSDGTIVTFLSEDPTVGASIKIERPASVNQTPSPTASPTPIPTSTPIPTPIPSSEPTPSEPIEPVKVCTDIICWVGTTWNVAIGKLAITTSKVTLQEYRKTKWVTVEVSKTRLVNTPDNKKYSTCEIQVNYSEAGSHKYRLLAQGAKTANTKVLRTFIQAVI